MTIQTTNLNAQLDTETTSLLNSPQNTDVRRTISKILFNGLLWTNSIASSTMTGLMFYCNAKRGNSGICQYLYQPTTFIIDIPSRWQAASFLSNLLFLNASNLVVIISDKKMFKGVLIPHCISIVCGSLQTAAICYYDETSIRNPLLITTCAMFSNTVFSTVLSCLPRLRIENIQKKISNLCTRIFCRCFG